MEKRGRKGENGHFLLFLFPLFLAQSCFRPRSPSLFLSGVGGGDGGEGGGGGLMHQVYGVKNWIWETGKGGVFFGGEQSGIFSDALSPV